jgi:hypothetical protein
MMITYFLINLVYFAILIVPIVELCYPIISYEYQFRTCVYCIVLIEIVILMCFYPLETPRVRVWDSTRRLYTVGWVFDLPDPLPSQPSELKKPSSSLNNKSTLTLPVFGKRVHQEVLE